MTGSLHRAKRQNGFTLIEIISVLVILGILAVIALPKYLDLQKQAAFRSAMGGVAALTSEVVLIYAQNVLATPSLAGSWAGSADNVTVGDFLGKYTASGNVISVSITGYVTGAAPSAWWADISDSSANLSRVITIPK